MKRGRAMTVQLWRSIRVTCALSLLSALAWGQALPSEQERSDPDSVRERSDPEAQDPEASDPEPADPEPADPESIDAESTDPESADPESTDLESADPEPADPESIDAESTDPESTDPEPADPEPADPEPVDPEPANPDANASTDAESELEAGAPEISDDPVGTSSSIEEPAPLPPTPDAGPFAQHSVPVGVTIGWTSAADRNWLILGGGAGYFVLDGLAVHADGTLWIGADPFIATVSPGLRYVFHMVPTVKPYLGVFYRHYFVAENQLGWGDSDALGGRVGLNFMTGKNSFFGGGVMYQRMLDTQLFSEQDQVYPEVTFAFVF